jgi:hypothetical protein
MDLHEKHFLDYDFNFDFDLVQYSSILFFDFDFYLPYYFDLTRQQLFSFFILGFPKTKLVFVEYTLAFFVAEVELVVG